VLLQVRAIFESDSQSSGPRWDLTVSVAATSNVGPSAPRASEKNHPLAFHFRPRRHKFAAIRAACRAPTERSIAHDGCGFSGFVEMKTRRAYAACVGLVH